MPNATATQVKKSNNPFDIFITGLRKGFNVAINNLMPNVLMAFVLAYILDLFGVMAFLGKVCGPVMSIFDLPGQAITVLCATWLSCGAGVGVAASLLAGAGVTFASVGIAKGYTSRPWKRTLLKALLKSKLTALSIQGQPRFLKAQRFFI